MSVIVEYVCRGVWGASPQKKKLRSGPLRLGSDVI